MNTCIDDVLSLATHRLHCRVDGRDVSAWQLLCSALSIDLSMWDTQVAVLANQCRVLHHGCRSDGASSVPVAASGLAPLCDATAERWSDAQFRQQHAGTMQHIRASLVSNGMPGHIDFRAVLANADACALTHGIDIALLAISADQDPVCPAPDLHAVADA
jgi:hypothetical protein